jgi:hypothetical protein
MAYYEINGKVIEASSPDEARAKSGGSKDSWVGKATDTLEDAWVGFKTPFQEAAYGIDQAVGGLEEGEAEELAAIRKRREDAGWAGTAGELATWLMPAGLIAKGAMKGATMLPKAMQYLAPMLAEGAVQGAYEGSRATLDGDPSRTERALKGAAWGTAGAAGGHALGKTLENMVGGFTKRTPEAEEIARRMQEQGLDPETMTLGQQAGGAVQGIESKMSFLPTSGVDKARKEGLEEYNKLIYSEARPVNPVTGEYIGEITEAGTEGFKQLDAIYSKLYDDAIEGATIQADQAFIDGFSQILNKANNSISSEQTLSKLTDNLKHQFDRILSGKIEGGEIKAVDTQLRELIDGYVKKQDFPSAEIVKDFRDSWRALRNNSIGLENALKLESADAGYGRLMELANAQAMAGSRRGDVWTPTQLEAGVAKGKSTRQKAKGETRGDFGVADEVYGSKVPEVGSSTAEKVITAGTFAPMLWGDIGTTTTALALPYAMGKLASDPTVKKWATGRIGNQPLLKQTIKERVTPYLMGSGAAYMNEGN